MPQGAVHVTHARAQDTSDDLLRRIAEATAPLTGEPFFRVLVEHLATALSFHEVFVTECVGPDAGRVRMLGHWRSGAHADNVEYELSGTPCERTIRERQATFIGDALQSLYPEWPELRAYLGVPIFAADGAEVVGHIAFFDDRARDDAVLALPVFRILAARAGAELLRKRAEDALRRSEAQYRLLVDNQTDMVVALDSAGCAAFVSPSFCRVLGRPQAGLLGAPIARFIDPRDREAFAAAIAAARDAPYRGQTEVRLLAPAASRWFAWMFTGTLEEARPLVVAVGRDVTDRRLAEDRVRQHVETLAHLARVVATDGMASAIAHEVNQPLTAVIAYTQACIRLLRSGEAGTTEALEWMERVAAQAELAADVVQGMRSFVRRGEAQRERVHADRLVRDVAELMRPRLQEAGVRLTADVPPDLPPVLGDPVQLQQVLLNIVANAVDALRAGGSIHVHGAPGDDGLLRLCIDDDGPGFGPGTQARLFEPFFTTRPEGMGIGLAITRAIVEAHGGTIGAQRRSPAGARFVVALPIAV